MGGGLITLQCGGKAALLAFNFRWLSGPEKIMDELQDKSVLVVDDDPGMLWAMTKVLAREGMQVTGVSDPSAVVTELADAVVQWTRGFGACQCPAGIAGYHHHGIRRV